MKLSTTNLSLENINCDACIIPTQGRLPLLKTLSTTLKKEIQHRLKSHPFSGRPNECIIVESSSLNASYLLLVGCGKNEIEPRNIEQAISSAIRAGISAGCRHFSILNEAPQLELTSPAYQLLIGRGAIWGSYQYLLGKSNPKASPKLRLTYVGEKTDKTTISHAQKQGDILKKTADLANSPSNIATPKHIAKFAKSLAKSSDLSVQILGKKELGNQGFDGILAVSQGSVNDPQMIIINHNPKKSKKRPIVLIGKTVTFDSGGISLKPGKNMGWMRYDKCGGISILATMQMLDAMQTDYPVIGILGAAENMPDAAAIRPGDIIKMHAGKTVEVLNTDAEGRLILADILSYSHKYKPEAIVDVATLTGAVIIALGHAASAVLGSNQKLIDELLAAGSSTGERLWQLPLYAEYLQDMNSDFADLANLSKSGNAGTATAAAFLSAFVPPDTPWAHLDIAGTAWEMDEKPYQAAGATIFGARLLTQWITDRSLHKAVNIGNAQV